MRIKNKELRQRRHRKEQRIKEAQAELRKLYANKPVASAASPAAPKAKAAPKKAADAAKPAAKKETKKKAETTETAEKPKAAKKKAE